MSTKMGQTGSLQQLWLQVRDVVEQQSRPTLLAALLAFLAIAYVCSCLIQLYTGPLAKYPGPRFCGVSRLPWVWHEATGGMSDWIRRLHLTYGDVVRVAPDELSFSNSAAWKDVYGPGSSGSKAMEKASQFYVTPEGGNNPSIVGASNKDHPRLRRALLHPFSERAVNEMEPLLRRHLENLVNVLDAAGPSDKFDMVTMYNYAAFDIMSDYAFDDPLNMLTSPRYRSWVDTTFGALYEISLFRMVYFYPWTAKIIPFFVSKSTSSSFQQNYQHCVEGVNKSLEAGPSLTGLLGRMLDLKEDIRLTPPELHVNLQTLMVAGTETSAALLSGATYYLLKTPSALAKLKEELRTTFPTAGDIHLKKLAQLPFLNACIEETLRLQPPVPLGVPREIPVGGAEVCGKLLPEKTVVYVSPIVIGRDPSRFNHCDDFIPERWLGGAEYLAEDRSSLQPFSYGPRNCLGKSFAYHKARMAIATVMWHFELSLCDESKTWADNLRVWSVWERRPLMVRVAKRKV